MADHEYRVLRHMQGDKDYAPGDTRVASSADVQHLVPHALEDLGPVKVAPAPRTKKDRKVTTKIAPALSNKGEGQ